MTRAAHPQGALAPSPPQAERDGHFTARTINLVNIGLMLASLLVASCLPFELLLFSWVVLGPLHYLTEIS